MDTAAIIAELRSMHGHGLITEQLCVRAERYVHKYREYMELTATERDVSEIADQIISEV